MIRFLPCAALLLAVACSPQPPAPTASLPADAVLGAGDPTRSAVNQAAYVFANPARFAGRPADVARALANQEYLVVAVPADPSFTAYGADLVELLASGRDEARAAFGIDRGAAPQLVIDRLYAASRALGEGDQAGAERQLAQPTFANGAATIRLLQQPPALPRTNVATSRLSAEMLTYRSEPRL